MLRTFVLLCACALLGFNSLQASDAEPILPEPVLPKPELIHFENQVETQPLEAVDKPRNGVHHSLNLITGPAGNQNIQIPSNRPFKIVFKGGGSGLSVVDNNALDGEATVQLPSGMLEGYIQARGKPNQSITYSDSLYHSEQVLSHSKKPQWYRMGKRPMPIPADWHSADGADYVLHFDNQGQENISFRWYPVDDNEEPDYPVGMKLIGPEGGVVELPGVGKLELPEGALEEETLIRMSQVEEAYKLPDYTYVSPMVRFEPSGLQFEYDGLIQITPDLDKVQNISAGSVEMGVMSDKPLAIHTDEDYNTLADKINFDFLAPVNLPVDIRETVYNNKFHIEHFSYGVRLVYDDDIQLASATASKQKSEVQRCYTRQSFAQNRLSDLQAIRTHKDFKDWCGNLPESALTSGHFELEYYLSDQVESLKALIIASERSYSRYHHAFQLSPKRHLIPNPLTNCTIQFKGIKSNE